MHLQTTHIQSFPISIIILLSLNGTIISQTNLSGFLNNQVFIKSEGSPFIIDSMLAIPENQSITIRAGCCFQFLPSAGIIVDGRLIVEGTDDEPVLFTNINDSLTPPSTGKARESSKWHGIIVTEKATEVDLSHFILRYSTYGIESRIPHIVVSNGSFSENDSSHFSVNDTVMQVKEGIPYNYPFTVTYDGNDADKGGGPSDTNRYCKNAVVPVAGNTGKLRKIFHSFLGWNTTLKGRDGCLVPGDTFIMGTTDIVLYAQWDNLFLKKGIPILIGSAGVIAGGVTGWSVKQWMDGEEELRTEMNPNKQKEIKETGKNASIIAFACGTITVAAIPSAIVLYIKNHKKRYDSRHVLLQPLLLPRSSGLTVSFLLPDPDPGRSQISLSGGMPTSRKPHYGR